MEKSHTKTEWAQIMNFVHHMHRNTGEGKKHESLSTSVNEQTSFIELWNEHRTNDLDENEWHHSKNATHWK